MADPVKCLVGAGAVALATAGSTYVHVLGSRGSEFRRAVDGLETNRHLNPKIVILS
jgi:hypothetical protein